MAMTFDRLKFRLDRFSNNDWMYERPMNWTEAVELLMIHEQLCQEVERLKKQINDIKSMGDWNDEKRLGIR